MRLMRSFWYLGGPLGFLLVFFLLPLVLLLGVSLTEGYPLDAVASLGSYRELFVNAFYRSYLITTLAFGLTVTALCLLAGYPLAYFLVRHARRSYRPLLVVVVSPLLVSVVARTVGWTIMLGNDGTLNRLLLFTGLVSKPVQILFTPLAATIGMVHVLLPFIRAAAAPRDAVDRPCGAGKSGPRSSGVFLIPATRIVAGTDIQFF